ncbi:LysR family transcriptional regulator [Paenibacillus sp. CAU 1782]
MNFIKLDILVLLHQHKKITAVADALGVKQPTVTFHMKSLEEQYGVPLFETYGGKYELTRAGKALLHYARRIRALGLEAGRVMSEQRSPDRGTFHIGASYVAGTYLLPAWMHQFRTTYPEVEIRLTIRTAPVIRQLLAERHIDLGFIAARGENNADGLRSDPICEDRLVVAFAADHPLALHGGNLLPEEIAAFPFLLHGTQSTTREMTEHWTKEHDITFHGCMELDSLETIKRSLMLGGSITFISHMAIAEEVASGRLAYADLPGHTAPRMIYACYHPERWISPQMEAFLHAVKEEPRP